MCLAFLHFSSNWRARILVTMKGGRKHLKRAAEEKNITLQEGQKIMQVVSLRGSNCIEVVDAQGEKSLALFPAKFYKSMWIKQGSFVVVDDSGREKALESGRKVACIVTQVLYWGQIRVLRKSPEWPEIFKPQVLDDPYVNLQCGTSQQEENQVLSSDDEGLPPLEANTNRIMPADLQYNTDSSSDPDSDS